jgi:hypothetical protein
MSSFFMTQLAVSALLMVATALLVVVATSNRSCLHYDGSTSTNNNVSGAELS